MANVGNLFVNFSGNTKGLTKSLSSAKSQIDKFDKEIGRKKGGSLGRAKGRFEASMNERKKFESFIGPRPAGESERMGGRIQKKEKGARQAYRQAQREQTISGMRKSVAAAVGVFGLTVAGIGLLTRKAMQQTSDAVSNAKKFEFMGPNGPAIIAERIKMITDAMAYAQTPEGSAAQLKLVRSEANAQRSSFEGGGATYWQQFNAAINDMTSTIGRGWVEASRELSKGNVLGQKTGSGSGESVFSYLTGIGSPRNANRPTGGY